MNDAELLALAELACGEYASCQCNELSGDELSQGKTCESCTADYAFHQVATIDRISQLIKDKQGLEAAHDLIMNRHVETCLELGQAEARLAEANVIIYGFTTLNDDEAVSFSKPYEDAVTFLAGGEGE